MTSEQIRQRSDLINTRVVTRDTAKNLGVVKELLVDIDRREVVALGLRDNLLSIAGMPRYMLLSSIRQMGDVILVDNDDVVEDDVEVEAYSSLINSEVITETGELLGRVRGFKFTPDDGKLSSLIIASLGLPLIPEQVLSTYELPVEEIVSSGPNRLIVFEGAEERLNQLSVGVLERLGLGKAPWERDEDEQYYSPPVARVENQLPPPTPLRTPPIRTSTPVVEKAWDENDGWEEPEPQPLRRRREESVYYQEVEEEDNWSEATTDNPKRSPYQSERPYVEPEPYKSDPYKNDYVDEYEEEDVWEDAKPPEPYKAPKVNIPEKTKAPEYEEESGY